MMKILVIDDNEDILKTLQELFSLYEYQVLLAENGKEGIKMAELHQPDLIILDALMPVMDGFETCRFLKSHPHLKEIPVIFLSANYTDEESRMIGLELGADDYLLKPFNTRELVAKVKALLKRKYLIDNLRQANQELLRIHDRIKRELEAARAERAKENILGIDPLTGFLSRENFLTALETMVKEKTSDNQLSFGILSIDNLGSFREIFEETVYNYILIKIVNLIIRNVGPSDILGQLSMNRIGIIHSEKDVIKTQMVMEKIRAALSDPNLVEMMLEEIQPRLKRKQKIPAIILSIVIAGVDEKFEADPLKAFQNISQQLDQVIDHGGNKTVILEQTEKTSE